MTLASSIRLAMITLATLACATPAASAATGTLSADSAATPTYTVPAEISNNCTANVSGALNVWIKSVPDGSILKFDAGACYQVDYTLQVVDRHDLVFDGAGASFEARTTFPEYPVVSRPMWNILGGSNVELTNMTAKGTNPTAKFLRSRAFYPLFKFDGTQTGGVDHVNGLNSWGDFVSITPDTRGLGPDVFPSHITVENSTTNITGRHTVMCNGCEDVVVQNNSFMNSGYQVFDIEVEAPNWHARNISYLNNTIGGRIGLSVLVNAGNGTDVSGITFAGNTMTSTPLSCSAPIYVLDTDATKDNWVIENNYLRTLGAAARLAGVTDLSFDDNTVTLVRGGGCEEKGVAVRATNADVNVTNNDLAAFTAARSSHGVVTGLVCGNQLAGEARIESADC